MPDEKHDAPEAGSEPAREGAPSKPDAEGSAPPATPFDNPYFLPGLLFLFALWFGYDGWFNPEIKSVNFNRYGFVGLLLAAIYFTVQTLRDARRSPNKSDD